jgi:ribosome maturation factor RimP
MVDKSYISQLVRGFVEGTDYFIVDVRVSSTGKITVLLDKKSSGLMVEDCVKLSRFIEGNLDREQEDFELQVSSPGLEMPFLVIDQYIKNQGRLVEVLDNEGVTRTGTLKNVTAGGFEIETETKVKGKGREVIKTDVSFNFEQVKSARTVIIFK